MANQLKMAQVHTIQNLSARGRSKRSIALELGIHRDTVTRHLEGEGGSKCTIVRTGAGKEGRGRTSRCEPYRELIEKMAEAGLSAKRIYQDLRWQEDFPGAYDSVQRFVRKLRDKQPQRVWRMECEPAEEAQVDFGSMYLLEGSRGRRRKVHIWRTVLSHSRKGYSEALLRQDSESFIRGLENAFGYFGGVPRRICLDNLKAAVTQPDWYDPLLNPKVKSFGRHYGTVLMPTRPYKPEHKGKIERGIGYVKDNALKGKVFKSLQEINDHLLWWEQQVADKRIHGTTQRQVGEHFEQGERSALLPLPGSLFPCFEEGQRRVHRDSYVELKRSYYEVPEEYIGRPVWVRWDGRVVRIFNRQMELIRLYARLQPGQFTRTLGLEGRPQTVEKSLAYWYRRIVRLGPQCARWADGVTEQHPERALRMMQGLVSLNKKHSRQHLNEGCRQAVNNGHYRFRSLRAHLQPRRSQTTFSYLEEHELIRPLNTYDEHLNTIT